MTSVNRVEISWALDSDRPDIDSARIETLVRLVFAGETVLWSSVGIILGSHEVVSQLNGTYLDHHYDTDVLSFLIDESNEGIEGEVYVDVETASERHAEFGTTVAEEVERYVAHGVLHLAGYDDSTTDGKNAMRALEDKYLASLNSPDA